MQLAAAARVRPRWARVMVEVNFMAGPCDRGTESSAQFQFEFQVSNSSGGSINLDRTAAMRLRSTLLLPKISKKLAAVTGQSRSLGARFAGDSHAHASMIFM